MTKSLIRLAKSDVLGIRLDENWDDEPTPDEYPVWDNELRKCRNEPQTRAKGTWEFTSSPSLIFTQSIPVGRPIELGIRNAAAKAGHKEAIRLTIMTPTTDTDSVRVPISSTKTLHGDEWATFNVPKDFRNVKDLPAGSYTIIWSSKLGLVACNGFFLY
jgi:hypothetical protein